METLNLQVKPQYKSDLPIKIMQFGEGNFLRGFIDWMIAKLNDKNLFNGRILALQPTPRGRVVPKLIAQDCLYTTVLHGVVNGKDTEQIEIVNSIAKAKSPYTQWEEILEDACSPDLQFIFSNTTEAGITYTKEDFLSKKAPLSFPAKLTAVLYKRFKHYEGKKGSGLVIMPCELIDDNGTKLKNIVLQHVEDANLGAEFINYLNNECVFLNTLVDRVVSGYPSNADEYFAKIGYKTGTAALDKMQENTKKVSNAASVLGVTILGGLIASYVSLALKPTIDVGNDATISLQTDFLDKIIPNLLPFAFTFLIYFLLRKKVNTTVLIVGIIIAAIVLSFFGIL